MVRSFQKNARSESIVRQVSKMQESGIRPSGCKELWDSICVAITTDLDEIEQEAERHSEAPQLVPDLQQMQSMLNIMPPAHADVVSLHTRASSIVSGLQTKHAASGLETLLTKSSLSATDLKSLMQHYQSASAAGQITSDTGKKMMDIRPTVFRCIVDKCCHSSEKFSESMISVEVSILDAFNTNTLVVKAAGGRSADAGNIHAMRDLPRKASALRLALFRTEAAEDKGEVEHCCTELLPQLAKASEAFTEASLKYQGDDLRQKLSKEFFPHIDALDGGMHKWERKAETLVSKFATIQCNHAIDSLKDLAKAFARTAGGHNTMEGKNWYHGLATAELNKIASLHQQFKDTLAQAEIADTIDQDLAKIKKDCFCFASEFHQQTTLEFKSKQFRFDQSIYIYTYMKSGDQQPQEQPGVVQAECGEKNSGEGRGSGEGSEGDLQPHVRLPLRGPLLPDLGQDAHEEGLQGEAGHRIRHPQHVVDRQCSRLRLQQRASSRAGERRRSFEKDVRVVQESVAATSPDVLLRDFCAASVVFLGILGWEVGNPCTASFVLLVLG